jgi:hypothetical protein
MIENLLKAWAILVPGEIHFNEGYFCLKNESLFYSFSPNSFLTYQSTCFLQNYIQQCIEARGWDFEIRGLSGYLNGRLVDGAEKYSYCASIQGHIVRCSEKETILEALPTCYIEVLSS